MPASKRLLYLGAELEPAGGKPAGRLLEYDPDDLTTHGVCFGMTGSGKTGLCLVLLEEAVRSGVPVFMIDPKGDLSNLLLTFPGLSPQEFEPWIDAGQAAAAGQSAADFAAAAAAQWRQGLAVSGLGGKDVGALRSAASWHLYTPGSTAAAPVNVLGGFAPPPGLASSHWEDDPEPLRARIAGTVAALLDLVEIDGDATRSPEGIFLAKLFELSWKEGRPLTLESMIRELQDPSAPMRTLGAMDTEAMLPRARRMTIATALNALIASPSFASWTRGDALDIGAMARASDGRPRANIYYIAHLSERERAFFVASFLQALLTWMRTQPGTSSLRALFYMDEIFGYFPPLGNPPTKGPLLTLLKQGRAFGLGALLATQNPVDVDYKGLANAGTWFLGKLQTEQDRARLLDGLSGAGADRAAMERSLATLPQRSFVLHNVHAPGMKLFKTRWAMCYLRGPMTREEIRRLATSSLVDGGAPAARSADRGAQGSTSWAAVGGDAGRAVREKPPAGISERFLPAVIGAPMAPALRARVRVTYERAADSFRELREEELVLPLDAGATAGSLEWSAARPPGQPGGTEPPETASFMDLPDAFRAPAAWKAAGTALKGWLAAERALTLMRNKALKLASSAGETEEAFLLRCQQEADRRQETEAAALKAKYQTRLARLQERVAKESRELEMDKQSLEVRKMDEIVSAGETILGMFMGGRRRSLSGAITRRRMTSTSGARVQKSEAERASAVEELESLRQEAEAALEALDARWDEAAAAVEKAPLRPKKTGIELLELGLLWIPAPPPR